MGKGGLRTEPLGVVAGGDEQLAGGVDPDPGQGQPGGSDRGGGRGRGQGAGAGLRWATAPPARITKNDGA
jgi:hypothetical protein